MNTNCKKCRAPMRKLSDSPAEEPMRFFVTGFCCMECGHWNNLKRRKGYAEWDAKRMEARHGKA